MAVATLLAIMSPVFSYADDSTLADVRAQVIMDGNIPDTYFMESSGSYWNSYNGTINFDILKQSASNFNNNWLSDNLLQIT